MSTQKGDWQTHIYLTKNNANRTLGYLCRNFSLAPMQLKLLYKTFVRPKLEYSSSVWDLYGHISSLEEIQNRAARLILSNYSRTASVTHMKSTLNLPSLSLRRKISRLCLFHKLYHTMHSLSNSLFLPPSYISSRSDHHFKVGIPSSRTNLHFNSFVPTTSSDWNHLPASIASITDPANFKSTINAYPF